MADWFEFGFDKGQPPNAAVRRLGYTKTEMTGHGFGSMA